MYDLTPTATKLYATLLRSDHPLGRKELIDSAGISASSYDRRLDDVRELERVHAVQVEGHRRWTTKHTPSSSPPADNQEPPTPLLTHRQTNPPYRIVSSHPDAWARRRTAHADTDLLTPTQTMSKDTTLLMKRHRRSDHQDAQPSEPTPPDPNQQTPEPPTTPILHPNQG